MKNYSIYAFMLVLDGHIIKKELCNHNICNLVYSIRLKAVIEYNKALTQTRELANIEYTEHMNAKGAIKAADKIATQIRTLKTNYRTNEAIIRKNTINEL